MQTTLCLKELFGTLMVITDHWRILDLSIKTFSISVQSKKTNFFAKQSNYKYLFHVKMSDYRTKRICEFIILILIIARKFSNQLKPRKGPTIKQLGKIYIEQVRFSWFNHILLKFLDLIIKIIKILLSKRSLSLFKINTEILF